MKIKKGDTVEVISGDGRGCAARCTRSFRKKGESSFQV
jgi:ribosomal protein L24